MIILHLFKGWNLLYVCSAISLHFSFLTWISSFVFHNSIIPSINVVPHFLSSIFFVPFKCLLFSMMLRFVAAIVQYNMSFLHISCHNVTSTLILWMICRQPPPRPPSLGISTSSFVPCSKALTIAPTQNTTLI